MQVMEEMVQKRLDSDLEGAAKLAIPYCRSLGFMKEAEALACFVKGEEFDKTGALSRSSAMQASQSTTTRLMGRVLEKCCQ